MKKIIYVISLLLIAAILFCSCNENTPSVTDDSSATQESDVPEATSAIEVDRFKAVRDSGEEWLKYGLSAYENGKALSDLESFFKESSNPSYLTLYDHMFTYDKEKSVPVAEALFAFIYEQYGADALLDIDKRLEYKTEFLKSLGCDIQYTQPIELEAFLVSMDFSSNKTYKYIISFDNVTYYFEDFSSGTPAQYHGFLYYNTRGLRKMIEYLNENAQSEILDTDRDFEFYMTFDGSVYSKTIISTGKMYINDSPSMRTSSRLCFFG